VFWTYKIIVKAIALMSGSKTSQGGPAKKQVQVGVDGNTPVDVHAIDKNMPPNFHMSAKAPVVVPTVAASVAATTPAANITSPKSRSQRVE
jgi:hypothetical protein